MNIEIARYIERAESSLRENHVDGVLLALIGAVSEMSRDPKIFRHDWTPEELAQREKLLKPLTLGDLKRQVNEACDEYGDDFKPGERGGFFRCKDFEIRRRK